MKKVCRKSYWTLVNRIKVKQDYTNKWSDCLNEVITPVIMSDFYCLNFEACIDSKLRTFQLKILQRILTTKQFLDICNISIENCYFCKREIETIEHLFWKCSIIQEFWGKTSNLFNRFINFHGILSLKTVMLGKRFQNNEMLLNHLLIICKRYIYVVKCTGQSLSSSGFMNFVHHVYKIEKIITVQYKKNEKIFTEKWSPLTQLFEG